MTTPVGPAPDLAVSPWLFTGFSGCFRFHKANSTIRRAHLLRIVEDSEPPKTSGFGTQLFYILEERRWGHVWCIWEFPKIGDPDIVP